MDNVPEDDPLMVTAEVAEMLHRPEGTLRQWRHRGFGPKGFFSMGGVVMYRRSAVEAFLAECEGHQDAVA
jgi:hypothetical protein